MTTTQHHPATQILIIEDNPEMSSLLAFALSKAHYTVQIIPDGLQALVALQDKKIQPDLIILDWHLPGKDGLTVCKTLRLFLQTPVLMLTSAGETINKVAAFDAGANDYLTKPFDIEELQARIRNLLRHQNPQNAQTSLCFSDLKLNLLERKAWFGDQLLNLSPKEFELLAFFMQTPETVQAKENIIAQIWGWDYAGEANTVEVCISSLRKKLRRHSNKNLIHTLRGVGYLLKEIESPHTP